MLEDALSHVPRQKQAIRVRRRQGCEEPKLRRREVLGFVDDDMVERLGSTPRERVRQAREYIGPGGVVLRRDHVANHLEHRPQAGALVGAEPALAAHALDGRIRVERRQAPGVDDMGPLRQQETLGEALHVRGRSRLAEALASAA